MKRIVFALILLLSAQLMLLLRPASAEQTCTVIKNTGKIYVGCAKKGYEYTLSKPINGIQSFSAIKEDFHNPRCYGINANGIMAICIYKR